MNGGVNASSLGKEDMNSTITVVGLNHSHVGLSKNVNLTKTKGNNTTVATTNMGQSNATSMNSSVDADHLIGSSHSNSSYDSNVSMVMLPSSEDDVLRNVEPMHP